MKTFIVENSETGVRADLFLFDKLSGLSRSQIQKGIAQKEIKIVGKSIKPSYKVCSGDQFEIVDSFLHKESDMLKKHRGESIPLDIIFEDSNIIIINKPAGIVVHPANGNEKGTLVNALINYNKDIFSKSSDEIDANRPGIVHRLDKDTSGIIIIAKNIKTREFLINEFKKKKIKKTYLTLVFGQLNKKGSIKSFLGRSKNNRKKISEIGSEKGKLAITNYKSLEYFVNKKNQINLTLAEIEIPTGKTHQIRTQLKSIGHPIIGDQTYSTKESQKISKNLLAKRQLLHAKMIEFTNPSDMKRLIVQSPLPIDFQITIDDIEKYLVK